MKHIIVLLIFSFLTDSAIGQELKLATIFSDNMVLQQQSNVPIWGWDKKGTKITVRTSWNSKSYQTIADNEGKWELNVSTPNAGISYSITVKGSKEIKLSNVLIGEVWLASGQSNMSMPLKGYPNQPVTGSTKAILNSKDKNIHFINVPALAAYKPQDDIENVKWETATIETSKECSAVAWFFAYFIDKQLDVPIGIINASFGGSKVEAWMAADACKKFEDIKIPPISDETSPWITNVPTLLYNGIIHPIEGYTIKGVIWYQGESNIFNVTRYAPYVAAMVDSWRQSWKIGEFPFLFAQIAPFEYKTWTFFEPEWPEISAYIREAQMKSQSLIPNSAMAVLMHIGEEFQIHPARKKEVGERLGLLALNKVYNLNGFEAQSPEYDKMVVEGDKAIIHFKNHFMGLTSFGKKLGLFEIAGENKQFFKADAYIDGGEGKVVVSSKYVKEPKAVRYAFKNYVEGDLFGSGGLPVSSFRTDDW